MEQDSKSETGMLNWFLKYWVTIVSITLAISGLGWGIYTYSIMKKERKLTYYVHPVKAAIVRSGQVSNLSVLHRNQEINSDISATQIAIWNQGRESIRTENILSEVRILMQPQVPILDATIRKNSRSVTDFSLDKSHLTEGAVPISWKILEQNDGAVIQLIYAGPPETDITVEGVVEGQPRIFALKFLGKIKSASEQFAQLKIERLAAVISLGGSIVFSSGIFIWVLLKKRGNIREILPFIIIMLFFLGIFICLLTVMKFPEPPFGF